MAGSRRECGAALKLWVRLGLASFANKDEPGQWAAAAQAAPDAWGQLLPCLAWAATTAAHAPPVPPALQQQHQHLPYVLPGQVLRERCCATAAVLLYRSPTEPSSRSGGGGHAVPCMPSDPLAQASLNSRPCGCWRQGCWLSPFSLTSCAALPQYTLRCPTWRAAPPSSAPPPSPPTGCGGR